MLCLEHKGARPRVALTNLLVPGAATLLQLAPCLDECGVLNWFVYAHARATTPQLIGLSDDRATNLWLKEYLVRGHLKLIGFRWSDELFPLYHRLWENGVLRRWRSAPIAHVLLWGAAPRVLAKARGEGSTTLGYVVNAHPRMVAELLAAEADRIGLKTAPTRRRLENAILEEVAHCEFLQCESEFVRRSFAERGYPREKIHIVRTGKDFSRFHPASEAEAKDIDRRFRVLCVGAVSLRKGQIHLLEAWRGLGLRNATLTLIGAMNADIEPMLRPFGESFDHVSSVPNTRLREYYIRSSVMVLPSIEDGHANVVGEALACGIPVITTVNNGSADYIRDGVNGYVVSASSPAAIAEKLSMIYESPELLRSLREGARATMSAIGTWRDCANNLATLYRRIAPVQDSAKDRIAVSMGTA